MNHKTLVNIASFLRGIYPLKIKEGLYATEQNFKSKTPKFSNQIEGATY